jgi:hypothetical protein
MVTKPTLAYTYSHVDLFIVASITSFSSLSYLFHVSHLQYEEVKMDHRVAGL